jgi:hypothetical protein
MTKHYRVSVTSQTGGEGFCDVCGLPLQPGAQRYRIRLALVDGQGGRDGATWCCCSDACVDEAREEIG